MAKAKTILAVPENPHYLAPTAARLFKKLDECVNGNPTRKKGQWQFDALSFMGMIEAYGCGYRATAAGREMHSTLVARWGTR